MSEKTGDLGPVSLYFLFYTGREMEMFLMILVAFASKYGSSAKRYRHCRYPRRKWDVLS
jgi:hypothetical protein